MCGIVGYVGGRPAVGVLVSSLARLEYRGYDSAGVAVLHDGRLWVEKGPGRVEALASRLSKSNGFPKGACLGLGHTRWATHGGVTLPNAHPHLDCAGRVAVVHNGIIENHDEIRRELVKRGHRFRSETDTEVAAHLVEEYRDGDPLKAVTAAVRRLEGSFALGVLFLDRPDRFVVARRNSPLVLGFGKGEGFAASDVPAILPYTRRVQFLEEGEVALVTRDGARIVTEKDEPRRTAPKRVNWSLMQAEKGGHPHYMLKEIMEEPDVVAREVRGRFDRAGRVRLDEVAIGARTLKAVRRIVVAACGTAYHAGLYAKTAIEDIAGVPVEPMLASELRYGDTPVDSSTLLLVISQSGETADTLAAMRMAKARGAPTLAVCNVRGSTIAREADGVLPMRAGLEVGVAATKTYVSQLTALALLAMRLGRVRGTLPAKREEALRRGLEALPRAMNRVLESSDRIAKVARRFMRRHDFMFIGRRYNLPTAYEGALKMKEITYRHAEGYGAGEMKHGPLAMVDGQMVTVAIATRSAVYAKMLSNIQEIKARKGKVVGVVTEGDAAPRKLFDRTIAIPDMAEELSPIAAVVPLQLLAYHTAAQLGRDVDKPRNLAKSVTVE